MSAKSNVPWSVKGIDPDARSVAKELARRRGMTLGEFITDMIREKGLDEAQGPSDASQDKVVSGVTTDQLRGVVDTLNRLNERLKAAEKTLQSSEAQSREAMGGLNRGLETVFERVKRLERETKEIGAPDDLAERLDRLEGANEKNSWVKSLVALERALSTLVEQVETSREDTEERLVANEGLIAELKARLDAEDEHLRSELSGLTEAIDATTERVNETEGLVRDALSLARQAAESHDETFIERTSQRLQLLGSEIKRTSDHIRSLETSVSRLSEKIEAGEERSAEGISRVAQSLESLRREVDDASAVTGEHGSTRAMKSAVDQAAERVDALQGAFSVVIDRLEGRLPADTPVPAVGLAAEAPREPASGAVDDGPLLSDFGSDERAEDEFDRAFDDPLGFNAPRPEPEAAPERRDTPAAAPEAPHGFTSWAEPGPGEQEERGFDGPSFSGRGAEAFFAREEEPRRAGPLERPEPAEPAARQDEHRDSADDWDGGAAFSPRFDRTEGEDGAPGFDEDPFAPDRETVTSRFSRTVRGLFANPAENNPQLAWVILAGVVAIIGFTGLRALEPEANEPVIVEPIARPAMQAAAGSVDETPSPSELYAEAKERLARAAGPADMTAGMAALVRAAEAGSPLAMHDLGEAYLTGDGVAENGVTARRWFEEAARAGHIRAVHRLAYLDANGIGGPADMTGALEGFRRAAEAGLPAAMFNLGTLYDPDNAYLPDSERDLSESYVWYRLAAAQGDQAAADKAAVLGARMAPEERAMADARVASFTPMALQP